MRNYILVLFLSFSLISACDTTPKFVGSWELVSLKLENESITAGDLGNPVYTFNENNTYTIEVTGLAQNGSWQLEGEKLILKDQENPEVENILNIVEVQERMFHYTAGSDGALTDVILKRVD